MATTLISKKQSTIKDDIFKTSQKRRLPDNTFSTIYLDKTKIVNSKVNNERKANISLFTRNRKEDKVYALSFIHDQH